SPPTAISLMNLYGPSCAWTVKKANPANMTATSVFRMELSLFQSCSELDPGGQLQLPRGASRNRLSEERREIRPHVVCIVDAVEDIKRIERNCHRPGLRGALPKREV